MDDIPEGEQRLYLLRLRDQAEALARDCTRVANIADAAAHGEDVPPGMLPLELDRYVEAMVRKAPAPAPVGWVSQVTLWLAAGRLTLSHLRVELAIMLREKLRR